MSEHDSLVSNALNNMTLNELAHTYADLTLENRKLRDALTWYSFTAKDLTEQTTNEIWQEPYMLAHQLYLYGERARKALGSGESDE